jgi:branched-chain amino acid transport system permease protein
MQVWLNSLIQGLSFALVGLSFAIVYNTTRVFHIALGAIYAITPYLFFEALHRGMTPWVGVSVAVLGSGVLGVLCEDGLHWPLVRKKAPAEVHFIASLGLYLSLVQAISLCWGKGTQVFRSGADAISGFGGLLLTNAQLSALIGSSLLLASFSIFISKTSLGLQFLAMSDNPKLLSLLGRNVRYLRRMVFAVSSMIAAAASLLVANISGYGPLSGLSMVLTGLVATIVGGRDSLKGVVIAGICLGIIRGQVAWFASSQWEEAVTLIFLTAVLFLRPQGLFGRKLRLEEKV